ncbi:MAG: ATP-binding cassette domain-containing protein [Verrucomicrobiota bacterium]
MDSLLARNVTASRSTGGAPERIEGLTLGFEPATLNLLFGPPESGRNLLLRLLGLLERPEAGEVFVTGASTQGWSADQCADLRNRHFGFVFETPLLLPAFNVAENIAMPFFKSTEATPEEAREATRRVLAHVGLAEEAGTPVEALTLEAQQRVALARALVLRPQALFVENLDSLARDSALIGLLDLLAATRRLEGCCIIATARNADLVRFANRAVEMAGGSVVRDWRPGGLLS